MNSPRAGQLAQPQDLIDVEQLLNNYYVVKPDLSDINQRVAFGTSGHRGVSNQGSFNQHHLFAIAQAIVNYRQSQHITGPCFIGIDTHALSDEALKSVIQVLTANRVECVIAKNWGYTPTPVISHTIINYNHNRSAQLADGIVITPSHNPPKYGGIKYNTVTGAPAELHITQQIENNANQLLVEHLNNINLFTLSNALSSNYVHFKEYETDYINDLASIIDFTTIRYADLKIGVDPLGGSGITYWPRISEQYQLKLDIVNKKIDPTFSFMHLDHDGEIRMDCSSAYAMAGLIKLKDRFELAFSNDTDFDRHGIVTPAGLMKPNAYLATCVNYLFTHRPKWSPKLAVGKTLVTSSMVDRVTTHLGRQFQEFPVGFKWYNDGLFTGRLGFAGEESAGASFLRTNGEVWTTDKDGIILCLLAAEMTAKTGDNPQQQYDKLEQQFGQAYYGRIQVNATPLQKKKLAKLKPNKLKQDSLAGEKITQAITQAPANQAPIGGLKVMTKNGWIAIRPSGTEDAYKIYAESFISEQHLTQLQKEAQALVDEIEE